MKKRNPSNPQASITGADVQKLIDGLVRQNLDLGSEKPAAGPLFPCWSKCDVLPKP